MKIVFSFYNNPLLSFTVCYFNFAPYDCLIIVVLTHGDENNVLYAKDEKYNLNDTIINPIVSKNTSLAGKPKIIIIQACKGNKTVKGHYVTDSSMRSAPKLAPIPSILNLYFCFSTYEGHVSYRNTVEGGLFIQSFCRNLKKIGAKKSINSIMQEVTKELSQLDK